MTMNQKISGRIAYYLAAGLPIDQAYDKVMGDGAYMKLAGEVYAALRAA